MARSAYESALGAEPNFYPALLALVRIDIRNGDTGKAIQTANQWIARHEDIFNYNYAKIEALIADTQYESAISQCRALLKTDEANARLRYYLASAEFEKKRYRLADFIVGESLEIAPNDAEALFLRARIYDALSTEEVSLIPKIASTLDDVIALNPTFIAALQIFIITRVTMQKPKSYIDIYCNSIQTTSALTSTWPIHSRPSTKDPKPKNSSYAPKNSRLKMHSSTSPLARYTSISKLSSSP